MLQCRNLVIRLAKFLKTFKGDLIARQCPVIVFRQMMFRSFKIPCQRYLGQSIFSHLAVSIRHNLFQYGTGLRQLLVDTEHKAGGIHVSVHRIQMGDILLLVLCKAAIDQLLGQQISLFIAFQGLITHARHRLAAHIHLTFHICTLLLRVPAYKKESVKSLSCFLGTVQRKGFIHLHRHFSFGQCLRLHL